METTSDRKVALYLLKVQEAHAILNTVPVIENATFPQLREHHALVADAHRSLKKACRTYRLRLWVRRVTWWGEMQAVSMGYMLYEDVERP